MRQHVVSWFYWFIIYVCMFVVVFFGVAMSWLTGDERLRACGEWGASYDEAHRIRTGLVACREQGTNELFYVYLSTGMRLFTDRGCN